MTRTETELIEYAKRGDQEALAALIVLYRNQALRWAAEIVRDPHLAEDAVQEASIRLHKKLDRLEDASRFRPWFRTTVRRAAINLIRGAENRTALHEDAPEKKVQDFNPGEGNTLDPLQDVIRKELLRESMEGMNSVLKGKAQSVMHALLSEESLPEEIADRYQMARSNVYNIISRSRSKANEERYRQEMDRYLKERRRASSPNERILPVPSFSRPYALFSVALLEVLRFAGETDWTLTDIAGISGDAFRLNVTEGCDWRGISTFDWSYAFYQCMERLGWKGRCFGRPGRSTVSPEQQIQVLQLMQQAVDQGTPAVAWNLSINEFSLVYGYDDESRTIYCRSLVEKEVRYTYEQLGRNHEEPGIFAASLERRVTAPVSDRSIIHGLIRHVKGEEPRMPGFAFGLNGYRLWLESAQSGGLDPLGHAYQVAILSESREHAVRFLDKLADRARTNEDSRAIMQAADCYRRAGDALRLLYPRFPFGYGGAAGGYEWMAEGLQTAMEAEKQGVILLESALT